MFESSKFARSCAIALRYLVKMRILLLDVQPRLSYAGCFVAAPTTDDDFLQFSATCINCSKLRCISPQNSIENSFDFSKFGNMLLV
jgi:hypothetical protein